MKRTGPRSTSPKPNDLAERRARSPHWIWFAAVAGGLMLALWIYRPALHGPFLFDDLGLPFGLDSRANPVSGWVSGVRPVLMFSYWLNFALWGDGPFSYHLTNIFIHVANSALVFLVFLRLLRMADWHDANRRFGALAAALLFLIHPLQTEAVSYVAGRSESLMALFVLAAYVMFLYRRRDAISWREAFAVVALFALAVKTKENAVSFAGILVLTDLFWPSQPGWRGLRRNWRLYALLVPGAAVAVASVFRMLASAPSAGFSLETFKWYEYGFTEARALFVYIRMALCPVGQSIDHDFVPSRNWMDYGAAGWLALLAALAALAILKRRRYPLAAFGFLMFLVCLAPTSSVVPINDALVERRMYLALAGPILIGCEFCGSLRLPRAACGTALAFMLLVYGGLTHARNELYGAPEKLFAEAAEASTHNPRPYASLADVAIAENNCAAAVPHLERASRLFPRDYMIELSWGRILECLGKRDEAMKRLYRAAAIAPTSKVYELIGLLYGEMGFSDQAGMALAKAVDLGSGSHTAHKALALWYEAEDRLAEAEHEYALSLRIDPHDVNTRLRLARVREMQEPGHGTASRTNP